MSLLLTLLLTLPTWAHSRAVLQLEILALRRQLQSLQRTRSRRVRLAKTDRWLWDLLSRFWIGWRTALVIVKPETVSPGIDRASGSGGPGKATVAKYMGRRRQPPSQTWRTFLRNHVGQIVAADFFVVPTATYRLLFVLVLLAHDRRRIRHFAVTAHPTAAWTAQQHTPTSLPLPK
jgi:putative transposase